jgi:anti-sigma B factor antagonist
LRTENVGKPLEVRVEQRDGALVIAFLGEFDLSGYDEAATALAAAVAAAPRAIVVDLQGLSFMDSSGLRCLVEAKLLADVSGASMAIVNGSRPHGLLELTGMDGVIEMLDDLALLDPPAVGAPSGSQIPRAAAPTD